MLCCLGLFNGVESQQETRSTSHGHHVLVSFLLCLGSHQSCLFLAHISCEALAQAAQGVMESPSVEVFKKRAEVSLRDVV